MTSIVKFIPKRWLAMASMALALQSSVALAQGITATWQGIDEAAVRMFAAQDGLDREGRIWLGVQIRLAPGWKTYWRYPGESGAPPRLDWRNSKNLEKAVVRWPAPRRFSAFGFDSFGYHDEVVLPVLLQAKAPGKPLQARLELEYMVCANVCVPVQAKLALNLPPRGPQATSAPSAGAILIGRYMALVPTAASRSGLTIESAAVSGPAGRQVLRIKAHADRPFQAPDVMVEAPEPFGFGRPELTFGPDGRDVAMALPVYAGTGKAKLSRQTLTLTLVDGNRAVERQLTLNE